MMLGLPCDPLVHGLKRAIAAWCNEKEDEETHLAAAFNLKFKLDWLDDHCSNFV